MKRLLLAATVLAATPALALDPPAARQAIDAQVAKSWPALEPLYIDLHQHPETGFQEVRTAAVLAARMRKLGLAVTEKVGGTGLVAILRNGPGPTILIRTELDGLPMEEKTGLPYASRQQQTVDGKTSFTMHSCGHDTHMTAWIATAEVLLAMKAQWSGTVMFVAQPSEETVQGARAMLKDGLFTRFPKPDMGFAVHVRADPAGTVLVKDGVASSNSDGLAILFKGRGGHGSIPSATIDPIVMGAHFVSDVQSVVSRQKEAGTFGVVTVGSFQAGTVGNIIPDSAELKLSLRSFTPEVRALLRDGVERTARAAAAMAGAPEPVVTHVSGTAAVVNDHALSEKVGAVLAAAGGDRIETQPATAPGWSASEDYSAYVEAGVPSLYYFIGGYDAKTIAEAKAKGEPLATNHSPYFAPDPKETIATAVRTLTLSVLAVTGK